MCEGQRITLVDLPGVYSLNAYSMDEKVARDFLIDQQPSVVIVVADASNLERHLYLVAQLLEMGQNVVLCLNKMDLAKEHGLTVKTGTLAEILRVPVVEMIAIRRQGIERLKSTIARNLDKRPPILEIPYGTIDEDIRRLSARIESAGSFSGISARAAALRILQDDQDILEKLKADPVFPALWESLSEIKSRQTMDLAAWIAEKKYAFTKGMAAECSERHLTLDERVTISDKIDRVVTHKFLGIPIFLSFMFGLFFLVFKIGGPLVELIHNQFFIIGGKMASWLGAMGAPVWFASLVSDGIFPGMGSVLAFLPYIMLLYLGISLLQDTGYLARAAFIMDRLMHALGLHGKSFIPMLLGFGCNIPGIMAARTLGSYKDRILTILILPLMSCAARLPVYTLFAAALFPRHQHLIVFSLYLTGMVLAVIMARIFRRIFFKEDTAPLIMELPPYRWPNPKDVAYQMWFQAWMFMRKAGTVIFLFVILTWALAYLPVGVPYASESSIIGHFGKWLAPVFAPAGFGFWQAAVALLFGILAKEMVVGILGTLYGVEQHGLAVVLQQHFTPLSGYAFLLMTAIYIPCIPAIVLIKKETNAKWMTVAIVYTFVLGWSLSVLFFQAGRFFLR